MGDVSLEVARAALVIGLVFTAFFYSRFRIVSGGAITGSFIAFTLLTGQWLDVAAWLVLSFVGMFAIRGFAQRWPLSRKWLFYLGVIVPAALHTGLVYLGALPAFEGLTAYLVAGLYVTNGLTAYDMQRQGAWRTLLALAAVVGATLLVVLPINFGMELFAGEQYYLNYFTPAEPLLILICVLAAAAVQIGLGWGTAGIIGALFLVNVLSVDAILLLVIVTAVGAWIARIVSTRLGLTPRQRLYSILVVSSIATWFALFWLGWLGIEAANVLSSFGVETLLVVGLMINEIIKLGPTRAYGGAAVVLALTAAAFWSFGQPPLVLGLVLVGVFAIIAVLLGYGLRGERDRWRQAIEAGRNWIS